MKHLIIALIVSFGLAFAPVVEAACNDADCAQISVQTEKKAGEQSKAFHTCACQHHTVGNFQMSASAPTVFIRQSQIAAWASPVLVSALVSPLLEPPSHA